MGSTTYEWILHHHSNQAVDRPQAWAYQQPAWVFTTDWTHEREGS
jgi:hypothetical protein